MGPVVHGKGCPWGELSMGRIVHGASFLWGELSMGRVVVGRVLMGRVDRGASFNGASCPGTECLMLELDRFGTKAIVHVHTEHRNKRTDSCHQFVVYF
jgi:hypothetical protein